MTTHLDKVLYTADVTSTGGREGRAVSSDGLLDVKLSPPKELGGAGGATSTGGAVSVDNEGDIDAGTDGIYASTLGNALVSIVNVGDIDAGGYGIFGVSSAGAVTIGNTGNIASTGDGIVAALQVLAIMLRKGRPLSELVAGVMRRVPQILKNVTLPARKPVDQMPQLSRSIASIESQLGREGRVLVRWSGTEPKLRVMVEGPDESRIAAYATELIEQAQRDMQPRAQTNG